MNDQQEQTQRRRFDRVAVELPAFFSVPGESGSNDARVVDLAEGGVRILCAVEVPAGQSIELEFELPRTGRRITARGRIVISFFDGAHQLYGHGVAFTHIAPDDRIAIEECVASAGRSTLQGLATP